MSERQGVEIDYCPQCRGVWLDRGELDKIMERSANEMADKSPQPAPYQGSPMPQDSYGYSRDHRQKYPKRRKSFLQELFD